MPLPSLFAPFLSRLTRHRPVPGFVATTSTTLPPLARHAAEGCDLAAVLAAARLAFQAALEGLHDGPFGEEALALSLAEQRACGLRELWHLRGALYTLIARGLGEFEARRRLARLDLAFSAARQ